MSDFPGDRGSAEQIDPGIPGFTGFRRIGKGGFGTVYRAHQAKLNRDVAIKVLVVAGLDERARRRFDREQQTMGSLSAHPAIVTIYGSGFTASGLPYLAMELEEGGSLADRVERHGPLPWTDAIELIRPIADAVEEAHQAGVLHRDIKPENILISGYGSPMLADFGIAGLMEGTATATSSVTATVEHAAPEVLAGEKPGKAADIYSLGSTLFALITGLSPFRATTDESVLPIIARVATAEVPNLRPQGIPDAICSVLERTLAKSPEERYASAREFGEALEAAATASRAEGAVALPAPSRPTATDEATTAASSAPPATPMPPAEDDGTRVLSPDRRPVTPPVPAAPPGPASPRELAEPPPPTVTTSVPVTVPGSVPIQVPKKRKSKAWLGWVAALLVLIAATIGIIAVVNSSGTGSTDDTAAEPGPTTATTATTTTVAVATTAAVAAPVATTSTTVEQRSSTTTSSTTTSTSTSTTTTTTSASQAPVATATVIVPDLGQLHWTDARDALEALGLVYGVSGTQLLDPGDHNIDRVLDQDPWVGEKVPTGTTVWVVLGEARALSPSAWIDTFSITDTGDGFSFPFHVTTSDVYGEVDLYLYVKDAANQPVASAWPSDTYTVGGQLGSFDYFYSEGSTSYNGSIWLPYGAFPGLGEYNVYLDARDGTTQEDYDIVSIGIRLSG